MLPDTIFAVALTRRVACNSSLREGNARRTAVTKVVAVGAWAQVGARIRLALGMALVMGMVAVGLLLALQQPLWLLLADTPKVLPYARSYFYLRVIGVPPQLLVMCTSGILQGYKRVNLVACLQGGRVLLDVFASYVALYVLDWGLVGVGLGTILASSAVAAAAFVCILLLPPAEGRHKIHIFTPLLSSLSGRAAGGKRGVGCWSPRGHGVAGGGDGEGEEALHVPLLDGHVGERGAGGGAGELTEEEERVNEVLNESTWKFIWDGLSTMLRSALVQASFFLVLACATSLGMHAVAAHQVLMQLWMINIYIADGFATAGTIVASSVAGHLAKSRTPAEHAIHLRDLREACWRVLNMGAVAGVAIAAVYLGWREQLMALFTFDEGTKQELRGAWLYLALIQPLNSIVFVYDGLIYAAQAFSYMAAFLTIGFFALFLPCIALAYFYFKTLVAAWGAKGVLNAVRFFVAGYKIHFDFLCPKPKFPPTNPITAHNSSASPAAAPGTVLNRAAPPALSSWINPPQAASSSSSVSALKWVVPGYVAPPHSVAEGEEPSAAAREAVDVLLRPCSNKGQLPPFPVLKTKQEELVNLVLASSRITLIASFIAASVLMPSGCWAQSTMSTTVHSDFFEGDVRIVVGPNRNQIRVQPDTPGWVQSVTPKKEYIVETYPFPSNFSALTDVKHVIMTFAPSNCYPIYNTTTVTAEQAIPAYLASGTDICLSCYIYLTFSFLDVDTASQIGSECTETDNGKLRGYICSTDEGADVTVAQALGSPPVVNGGGTSVGFLYTEMFVRQPAGSTMRLPSIRVDPLAIKGIGYIMVPSKGPTPLPGAFDAMPYIAGNNSKAVGVGLVFPITLITQAALATTPFSSNTVQTVTPTAFPALSMSAPANQSLTLNASIVSPVAPNATGIPYNISFYISKDATARIKTSWIIIPFSLVALLLVF
ncbi:unnamed protein product [Closterium sp. Yama58-4]|nr:unnamed protein product [Closterium sp. Yama58-4]